MDFRELYVKGDVMLEICVSGFFVASLSISLLLWRALAAAKRADHRLQSIDNICLIEPAEEKIHLMKLIPSIND